VSAKDQTGPEGDPPEETPLELVALALFADAIADPVARRAFANDSLGFLQGALQDKGKDFEALDPAVQAAFVEFFADLSYEELRLLARLQTTMVGLKNEGFTSLAEDVTVNSFVSLAKL
jgi:hypothetical protein